MKEILLRHFKIKIKTNNNNKVNKKVVRYVKNHKNFYLKLKKNYFVELKNMYCQLQNNR